MYKIYFTAVLWRMVASIEALGSLTERLRLAGRLHSVIIAQLPGLGLTNSGKWRCGERDPLLDNISVEAPSSSLNPCR